MLVAWVIHTSLQLTLADFYYNFACKLDHIRAQLEALRACANRTACTWTLFEYPQISFVIVMIQIFCCIFKSNKNWLETVSKFVQCSLVTMKTG